jgi:hypothetical protein
MLDEPNLAADDALVDVLPRLEPFQQAAALEILIRRGHPHALARVVGGIRSHGALLHDLIVTRAADLSAGIREAIAAETLHERAAAIETIVKSDLGRLAYLLTEALRARCPRTRSCAASGLREMTARWITRVEQRPQRDQIAALADQAHDLAEAVGTAIKRWDTHERPEVLEAARWLGEQVEPALREKLRDRHSKIARAMSEDLARASDAQSAGFALRALAIPELRSGATRAISRSADPAFLKAILEQGWLLVDKGIEAGCRQIPDGPWQQRTVNLLPEVEEPRVAGAVRFLYAAASTAERRRELLHELIGAERVEVHRAALWCLIRDRSEPATTMLGIIAARRRESVATMALRELRRRRPGPIATVTSTGRETTPISEPRNRGWLDQAGAGRAETPSAATPRDAVPGQVRDLAPGLRAKLTSTDPVERCRALEQVVRLKATQAFEDHIHRLAHDPDPAVRARAVGALAAIPGRTTQRLVSAAVNDPDERVAANAVEAVDALSLPDRERLLRPKLEAPNRRVRATAIKALLAAAVPGAAQALVDMLEAESASDRLSALWVVDRLGTASLRERLNLMQHHDLDDRVRRRARQVRDKLGCARAKSDHFARAASTTLPHTGNGLR